MREPLEVLVMVGGKSGPWPVRLNVASRTLVACYALSLLLGVLLSEAHAVGTWGGGEPPSSDDMYVGNGPWWLLPVALVALLAQIIIVGSWPAQTFCIFVTVVVGATFANWLGSTAGLISGGVTALTLYRWLLLEKMPDAPDHAAASQRATVTPNIPPEVAPDRKPVPMEFPAKKDVPVADIRATDQQAYAKRISGLRERIDKEAKRHC